MTSGDLAVHATDVVKHYGAEVRALDGISLTVGTGSIFALLGPNGAGKSTAVRILTTLARPDSGAVAVAGTDALAHPQKVRQRIGVVGQKHGSDPQATGRENMVLQGVIHGLHGEALRQRVDALLEQLGIATAADRIVRTWSGGMQRRLDIAMALLHRPRVLFLDEPSTGLDHEVRSEMWQQLRPLVRDDGLSILLTTHYLEEADEFAHQIAIIDRGKIVTTGTSDELKRGLHGDSLRLEFARDVATIDVSHSLASVAGLDELTVTGRQLRARVTNGASLTPAVLAALDQAGIGVASVTVARPSLADVYLRHTGREFARSETPTTTATTATTA